MNTRKIWASKEAAMQYIIQAEKAGRVGLKYVSACDYLGIKVVDRRELLKQKQDNKHK